VQGHTGTHTQRMFVEKLPQNIYTPKEGKSSCQLGSPFPLNQTDDFKKEVFRLFNPLEHQAPRFVDLKIRAKNRTVQKRQLERSEMMFCIKF
jgi:hypothetical protein